MGVDCEVALLQVMDRRGEQMLNACRGWDPFRPQGNEGTGTSAVDTEAGLGLGRVVWVAPGLCEP